MRYWLVNGNMHTAVTPGVQNVDILIENGKIAALGKAPAGEECVDVKGLEVYPGLVEAHCHLGLDGYAVK